MKYLGVNYLGKASKQLIFAFIVMLAMILTGLRADQAPWSVQQLLTLNDEAGNAAVLALAAR